MRCATLPATSRELPHTLEMACGLLHTVREKKRSVRAPSCRLCGAAAALARCCPAAVSVPFIVVVKFEGDKLKAERIYWDQVGV